MKETDPARILREAATSALAEAGRKLREQGWDAKIAVEAAAPDSDNFFYVTLSITIGHYLPIPVEARE